MTYFGADILLDSYLQPVMAANGETIETKGDEAALQDIKLRLLTPLGSLFYDPKFGSRIIEFVKHENTMQARLTLEAEVRLRINMDPRVIKKSARSRVTAWNERGVRIDASFVLTGSPDSRAMTISVGDSKGIIIQDGSDY